MSSVMLGRGLSKNMVKNSANNNKPTTNFGKMKSSAIATMNKRQPANNGSAPPFLIK